MEVSLGHESHSGDLIAFFGTTKQFDIITKQHIVVVKYPKIQIESNTNLYYLGRFIHLPNVTFIVFILHTVSFVYRPGGFKKCDKVFAALQSVNIWPKHQLHQLSQLRQIGLSSSFFSALINS